MVPHLPGGEASHEEVGKQAQLQHTAGPLREQGGAAQGGVRAHERLGPEDGVGQQAPRPAGQGEGAVRPAGRKGSTAAPTGKQVMHAGLRASSDGWCAAGRQAPGAGGAALMRVAPARRHLHQRPHGARAHPSMAT